MEWDLEGDTSVRGRGKFLRHSRTDVDADDGEQWQWTEVKAKAATAPTPSASSTKEPKEYMAVKKRSKMNGYLMYCLHRKRETERETGKKLNISTNEVLRMFDPDWNNLSELEKEQWKTKAKTRAEQENNGSTGSRE